MELIVLLACLSTLSLSAGEPTWICDRATTQGRPNGMPRADDVTIRSLRIHPRNDNDVRDTWNAIRRFHATRLEWTYLTEEPSDLDFVKRIKARGIVFGGAASGSHYVGVEADRIGRRDLAGELVIKKHKRDWKNARTEGCNNNPDFLQAQVESYKRYLDAGADVLHRDEGTGNGNAPELGGCLCEHCMTAFRRFLSENVSEKERAELRISDPSHFDYREDLHRRGAPVGDAFAGWDGQGPMEELFREFQMQSAASYFRRLRSQLDAYAGRRVPFSCNNSSHQRWDPPHLAFDWAMSEMMYKSATPSHIWQRARAAEALEKLQVFSMPKHRAKTVEEIPDDADVEWITRRVVATAYATGHLCRVPWDVFMQCNIPGYDRYFGEPEQYADLYGFVRALGPHLNGYGEVAAAGEDIADARWPDAPLLTIEGNERGYAFTRVKPGNRDAAVVVHLVDWSEQPRPWSVRLRKDLLFDGREPVVRFLVPTAYRVALHDRAETTGDYASLATGREIAVDHQPETIVISLPRIDPWGVLLISAR